MSWVTEVLIRREGVAEADPGVYYDGHVRGPEEAEADARWRCAEDPAIERIVYEMSPRGGKSRVLYTYVNPNPVARTSSAFAGNPLLSLLRAIFRSEHEPLV